MGLIISALVAAAGLLGLFHALIATVLFACIRADPNMSLISPEMDTLVIFGCLFLAWILGFCRKIYCLSLCWHAVLWTRGYRAWIHHDQMVGRWLSFAADSLVCNCLPDQEYLQP
jgi:hypothetical protein